MYMYLYVYIHVQYASKKTFPGRPFPLKPRSSPVRFPVHFFAVFVRFARFVALLEFLARAKLKSKAKKTTEKLGSMQKNI